MLGREVAVALRFGLGAFRGQHVDPALGDHETRPVLLQGRGLLAQRALGQLCALHRAVARLHQVAVAGVVGGGEGQRRLGGGDLGLLLVDRRLLLGDLGIEVADSGVGALDVGTSLIERDQEVAIVDLCQHLARLHRLIVLDQDPGDVTGDLGRYGRVVGLDVGVVGRDLELADPPVVVTAFAREAQGRDQGHAERGALEDGLGRQARLPGARRGGGRCIGKEGRHSDSPRSVEEEMCRPI